MVTSHVSHFGASLPGWGNGWLSNGMLGAAGLRFVVLCVQQVCVLPR
jgi:hypothetical protein